LVVERPFLHENPVGQDGPVREFGEVVGVIGALVLTAIACLHLAWAAGVEWGRAEVIPTVDGRPTLAPGRWATVVVAVLLLAAADLYIGAAHGRAPTWLFRLGSAVVATILLARAVGDFRTVGFAKRVRDTAFARRDTTVYSPLCVALAVCGYAVALR
jgi:hypothetical protein